MATLELSLDEEVAASPVKRTRRLGSLFWVAIAWIIVVFAAAGFRVKRPSNSKVPRPWLFCTPSSSDRYTWTPNLNA